MAFRALALALSMTALVLSGCSQSDEAEQQGGATGSASAYVKDAPSDDFREVHVVFTEVAVHRSGGSASNLTSTSSGTATGISTSVGNVTLSASATATSSANATSSDSGSQAGWVVLFADASGVDVDLLNTTGARAAFLGESDLDVGRYQQIRIEILEAYGIDHDGERVEITVSSGTLRSVKSFEVTEGMETRIAIDIDLEKSLRQAGNGQWRMTPVIGKTTAATVEDRNSGQDVANPGDVEPVPEAA